MTEAYKKRAARIVASLKKALEINDCIIEKENALSIKFKKESLLNNKDIEYIAYADIDLSQHLLILYCPFTEPLNEKEGLNQLLNDFNSYTYDGEFSISNKIAAACPPYRPSGNELEWNAGKKIAFPHSYSNFPPRLTGFTLHPCSLQ